MKTWKKPGYIEVRMNAEIGAYQGDPDFAPACLVAASEGDRESRDAVPRSETTLSPKPVS
jgi:hypothetical protein